MSKKLIASLMAIGIFLTLVTGFMTQPHEQNVHEYDLFDDIQNNIRAGLHFSSITEINGVKDETCYKILSIEDGEVRLSVTIGESTGFNEFRQLNSYDAQLRAEMFDYTDPSQVPPGVTVDKYCTDDVTVYRINGKYSESYSGNIAECTFNGLEATVNDYSIVQSYSGGICVRIISEGKIVSTLETEFRTDGGKVLCSYSSMKYVEKTAALDGFADRMFSKFDVSDYDGAEITSTEGTYCGFDVVTYTINGSTIYSTFKDYRVTTYHGHTVRMEGTQNGVYGVLSLEIWNEH